MSPPCPVLQGIELKQDDVLDEEERANIKVFQDNTPSVVNVTNLKAVQVLTACILFEILFFQSYHALSIIVGIMLCYTENRFRILLAANDISIC